MCCIGVVLCVSVHCGSGSPLERLAGAVGTRTGAMSRCILAVYTSYKQYLTVWTRERPPVRVPGGIYENRLVSAHLGLDPTFRTLGKRDCGSGMPRWRAALSALI